MSTEPPIVQELRTLAPDVLGVFEERDAAARLITLLPAKYSPAQVAQPPGDRAWELAGLLFLNSGRVHEALRNYLNH